MPAAVIPIRGVGGALRQASWSLLELAQPGERAEPLGILLLDEETDSLSLRLRDANEFEGLEEQEIDLLQYLAEDLAVKSKETGGRGLLTSLEDSLSNFLRISDRAAVEYTGDSTTLLNRLYGQHIGELVRPFVTHLPLYAIRAAATKFGEETTGEEEDWVRAPAKLRLTEDMFVARVVGRSMEPLIPDGSLCVFRANVTGTRQGKRLLIEKFGESSDANRYTVKVYSSSKTQSEDGWEHSRILLSPLNREFEAFELGPDDFRVIGEFVTVVDSH